MLKKWISYGTLIFLLMVAGLACRQNNRPEPSLNESYRYTDKQPFGAYIAYHGFRHLFENRYVEVVRNPFDKQWNQIKDYENNNKYSLYFLLTRNLVLSDEELKDLMEYVQQGNDLFIAADYVDVRLLQDLNCHEDRTAGILDETKGTMHQTQVRMATDDSASEPRYSYFYFPFLNSLSGFDTSFARVLGLNEKGQPDYVVFFSGKGRIYLDVAPRTFGNYFLLSGINYHYFEKVMSYLRTDPSNIYWDEFYKNTHVDSRHNRGDDSTDFSSLNVINQNPPLRWAFWLALLGMLIFLVFNLKRKQRLIPVIKPNLNTTVNFTETVGRLYLQKGNNRHIAEKMITYFFEYVRNKYFIGTSNPNEEFLHHLAGKSGRHPEEIRKLVDLIAFVQGHDKISDEKLLELNMEIEKFYKIKS